jgi:3-methyladenine DNA glycosylase AlkD
MAARTDVVALAEGVARHLRSLPKHNAASLRKVRRDVSAEIATWGGPRVVSLAEAIVASGAPGASVVAFELILYHPAAPRTVRATHLRRLGNQLNSWGAVDTFACYVAGRAWRAEQISDTEVAGWARSPNRWWRRAALVSTVPLNVKAQGGSGDARRTLTICRMLADDRDDMVVKAMSWALRSLAGPDPAAVTAFLDDYQGRLAPRVLREVRNKLATGRKTMRKARTSKRRPK